MSNPNEDYIVPQFSGEVWVSVCVAYDNEECDDQETLERDTVATIRKQLDLNGGLQSGISCHFEDSDLSQSNLPEGYMEKADRLYEQKRDDGF